VDKESLIALLDNSDPYVRSDAALNIGKMKLANAEVKLRSMCEEGSSVAALSAYHALWNMGCPLESIDLLLESLSSDDEELMQLAVQIVSQMGESLLKPVIAMLGKPNKNVKTLVMILEEVGGNAAFKTLQEMQSDQDPQLSSLIKEAIDDWEHG
jgi:HEAT repeat protein